METTASLVVETSESDTLPPRDAKRFLAGLKALAPIMEAVIANPGTFADGGTKAQAVGALLRASNEHLLPLAELVGADSPWAMSHVATVLNELVCHNWRTHGDADVSRSMELLTSLVGTRDFNAFVKGIGDLNWHRNIDSPLDAIIALKTTALGAARKLMASVDRFSFYQPDCSELVEKLLALSERLASSEDPHSNKVAPTIALNWRRSLLDRASDIVCAEYDRFANFNLQKMTELAASHPEKMEARKKELQRNFLSKVLPQIEKQAAMSFSTLVKSTNTYIQNIESVSQDTQGAKYALNS